jgi:hypothetical protein
VASIQLQHFFCELSHGSNTVLCTLKPNARAQLIKTFTLYTLLPGHQHQEPLNCAQILAEPSDTDSRFWVASIFASLS